mgnify:CR=1 FL=1
MEEVRKIRHASEEIAGHVRQIAGYVRGTLLDRQQGLARRAMQVGIVVMTVTLLYVAVDTGRPAAMVT